MTRGLKFAMLLKTDSRYIFFYYKKALFSFNDKSVASVIKCTHKTVTRPSIMNTREDL